MKQSTWLQNYEKEVNKKRNNNNEQKKKLIPILVIAMMGMGIITAIAGGAMNTPEGRMGMVIFIGLFVIIMLFTLLMLKIGKKKNVTTYTRNEVMALFQSDSDVEQFDSEMNRAPIQEVTINATTTMFMTQNYIGQKTTSSGDLRYSFIRKQDIDSFHKNKTGSTTGNPVNAAFFFDIRNNKQKVIMNGLCDSGKQLDAITEILTIANPEIRFE